MKILKKARSHPSGLFYALEYSPFFVFCIHNRICFHMLPRLALVLYFFSTLLPSHADNIVDDFNDNNKTNWSGSSTYQLTEANGELRIVSTKTAWRVFQKNIPVTDMRNHKQISLKIKVPINTPAPIVRLDLEDVNGFITNKFNNIVTTSSTDEYITYTFDYTNKFHQLYSGAGTIVPKVVDSTRIIKLTFHLNPGIAYNGTVYFDDIVIPGAQDVKLIRPNTVWQYAAADSVTGAWKTDNYTTSHWLKDTAQIGFGEGDEKTILPYGTDPNQKPITWYFKQIIEITDASRMQSLLFQGSIDDGYILYINGMEVYRNNLPTGGITHTTPALTAIEGTAELPLYIVVPANVLSLGENTIAIEVHQSNAADNDFSFDVSLTATHYTDGIIRGPYLQSASTTAVTVRWRTLSAKSARLKYGTDLNQLSSQIDSVSLKREHEIRVTALQPNTKYYYQIEDTNGTILKAAASNLYFTTHTTDVNQPLSVWVTGDAGRITEYQRSMRNAFAQYRGQQTTHAWLLLGDNAYNDGTDDEYQYAMFENMFEEQLANTVVWPSPGNHDLDKYDSTLKNAPYFSIFTVPTQGESGGRPSGTESYYSFNIGAVHFISLDSYDTPRDSLAAMGRWLKQDLESNTLPWIVAYWHHPPYSKGSHDSDDINDSKERNPSGRSRLFEMREQIVPLLERYGVDLVLTGHSHCYERSYMINGHYSTSDEFYREACIMNGKRSGKKQDQQAYIKNPSDVLYPNIGTVYAVVGASGETSATTTAFNTYDLFYFSSIAQTGSMVLAIEKDTLTARYIYADGTIADEFSIIKDQSHTMAKVLSITGRTITDPKVLQVLPNPASKEIQMKIQIKQAQSATIQLINSQGHEVQRICTDKYLSNGTHYLTSNLDNLPAGTYIVRMELNGIVYAAKLIKE